MVNELNAARIKRCRGIILGILHAEKRHFVKRQPMPVDSVVIRNVLEMFGIVKDTPELRVELDYLHERGYIRISERAMMGVTAILCELTATGQDLMDGIRQDDSILLDE
jgi:hypothetical protein